MKLTFNDEEKTVVYGRPRAVASFEKDGAYWFRVTYSDGYTKPAGFATAEERDEVVKSLVKTIDEEEQFFVTLVPSFDEEDTDETWNRVVVTDRPKKSVVDRRDDSWTIDVDGTVKKYADQETFLGAYHKVLKFVKSFGPKQD